MYLRILFTILLTLSLSFPAAAQLVLGGSNTAGAAPRPSTGAEGQFYIDWVAGNVWGPKASGSWGNSAIATFVPSGGAAGGDLSGTYPNPTVAKVAGVTPGTGVATALGVNIGSAGAPVLFNGAGGTPASMTATNLSGTAASLTAGTVTTNANLTGVITSTGNATAIASQTGTGTKFVVDTSPTLITPTLGAATATSINFGGTTLSTYTATIWTPAITTDGTVGTPAYSVQVGSYEQIGRQVTARFNIQLSGWTGSPTGNVSISGLPVAATNASNDNGHCYVSLWSVASSFDNLMGLIFPGASTVGLRSTAAGGGTTGGATLLTAAGAGTTAILEGICFYHT